MYLSIGAERLLALLLWCDQRFHRILIQRETMAEVLGVGVRQIERYTKELRSHGCISVRRNGPHAAIYTVLGKSA